LLPKRLERKRIHSENCDRTALKLHRNLEDCRLNFLNARIFAAFSRLGGFASSAAAGKVNAIAIVNATKSCLNGTSRSLCTGIQPQPAVDGNGERAKAAREGLATYCFSAGGFASGGGPGASGSGVRVVPRSSGPAAQSPAQSLVPLTVPTSLQPIGAGGFTCFSGLPPSLGAAV